MAVQEKTGSTKSPKTVFVQNLPYSTTGEQLKNIFKKYGEIQQCFVVADKNKPEHNCKGMGYVVFANADSSKTCVKNKLKLGGRHLRVYFAKPKSFIKNAKVSDSGKSSETEKIEEAACSKKRKLNQADNMEVDASDEDHAEEDGDGYQNETSKLYRSKEKRVQSKKPRMQNNEENSDVEDSDDDDDDGDEDDSNKDDDINEDNSDDEDEDTEYSNEEEEDACEEDGDDSEKRKKNMKQINERDAEDGKTLFIRNLSFDSVEDDLEEFFEEFGPLSYCRVVVNPKTQCSQGSAFVKFKFKQDAEKCLKNFEEDDEKFVIGGRKLKIMLALTKDKAKQMKEENKPDISKKGSQKNLHLIRLLLVRPGTQAAEGLSREDLMKRMKVESITREKLKNPNIFVSPTRLCIRNIPINVDEKQLRKVFLKAADDRLAKITECRIMRDLTRPNSEGVYKSRGYGFVEFTKHEHSLAAAQATNNNPEIFGDKRRLIVEFSLENKSALEAKQKRLLNSQARLNRTQEVKKTKQSFQYPTPAPNPSPKQKVLPSHWGAKIRHKARKTDQASKMSKKFQKIKQKNKFERKEKEPRSKSKKKIRETRDHLDVMISDYRNKSKPVKNS